MSFLRTLIIALTLIIAVYTVAVLPGHGINLVKFGVRDILAVTWPGQFLLDFICYLLLSAIWVVWRHGFTPAGWALGAVASVGGMLFFGPYLVIQIMRTGGDPVALLLGPDRADRLGR